MTIDEDSTGALWATWTQVAGNSTSGFTNTVYVNDSAPGGTSWASPFVIPVSNPHPAPDDISAVVAFSKSKIGIMWSDQLTGSVWWATHNDGTTPTATSSWNFQPAIRGKGQADDHLNLKSLQADPSGRVFAAVKTSLNDTSSDPTLPQHLLLVFKPGTGAFTQSTISTTGVTTTKQGVNGTSGLVVLASDDVAKTYWFSDRPLGPASPAPVASFTATPTSGTAPLSVSFTDTSTGTPTSWAWDFGDGGTSTVQNPTYSYAAPGTYTAKLTATNSTGSGSATGTVTVTTATTSTPLELNDATVGTGLNQFNYSGSWSVSNPAAAYQSDNHFANATNASYQVQCSGTQAKIFAEKSSALGIVGVSIDGGAETMVDPYASSRSEQNLLYTSPTLVSGTHTLKVRITGTKNPSATGTYAAADRVEISN
ncbi:PKD domain-containing protein [Arthrobacter liuii]|uniref:PKD domain-containing protein n=1 Tax=Arthrobacter liuii TaxID=1476996 RepID=A0ABQ2AKE5_9MICC|nr:PKD domain-containing protein [Arthrobacter liuii]GGH91199.1 hypothetical protein GCM10007170_06790 [Arthrobacter liuii]